MTLFVGNFPDIVEVSCGGLGYTGWTEVHVERSLKDTAGAFTVKCAERAGSGLAAVFGATRAIQPDEDCTVTVNGEVAITGQIDTRKASKDDDSHSVTITGRSKTRKAVDSHHVDSTAQYAKMTPQQINQIVAGKLGLNVVSKVTQQYPIEIFRYGLGEEAHRVMKRVSRKQGITITDTPEGDILMINMFSDSAPAALIAGQNLLSWEVERSVKDRKSKYHGKGQKAPNAQMRGKPANQIYAEIVDSARKSFIPWVVIPEGDVTAQELKERVKFEAARRAGESLKVTAVIKGWTTPGGGLWKPGQLAWTMIPDENVMNLLLIEKASYEKHPDKPGTRTTLDLVMKQVYQKGQGDNGSDDDDASDKAGAGSSGAEPPAFNWDGGDWSDGSGGAAP